MMHLDLGQSGGHYNTFGKWTRRRTTSDVRCVCSLAAVLFAPCGASFSLMTLLLGFFFKCFEWTGEGLIIDMSWVACREGTSQLKRNPDF